MSNIISYTFTASETEVRIIIKDDQPWFVAADVCRILGMSNPTEALRSLDDDEKTTLSNPEGRAGSGAQKLNIVNESGLYALIFKSRKPEAKKFRKWVTSEVLPQIRKTGSYVQQVETLTPSEKQLLKELVHKRTAHLGEQQGKAIAEIWSRIHNKFRVNSYHELPRHRLAEVIEYINNLDLRHQQPEPRISDEQYGQLRWKVNFLFDEWLFKDSARQQVYNYIRVVYSLGSVRDLPASRYDEVIAWLDQIKPLVNRFKDSIIEESNRFVREHICAGAPWTPTLKKDYRTLIGEKLPDRPDWVQIAKTLRKELIPA